MGRLLSGNLLAADSIVLASTLGNVNSNIRDNTTVSSTFDTGTGGTWIFRGGQSSEFIQNSVSEQNIQSNHQGVLQDPLSDYTYVQSSANFSGQSGISTGVVYDADLNPVYAWDGRFALPWGSDNLFCIRLYNSNLYFFSINSVNFRVTKVALPSGTITTFLSPNLGFSGTPYDALCAVFNWPINNKFWVYINPGSISNYSVRIYTFDILTESFAQFGTTLTRTTSDYLYQFRAMHVKADGSAVSIAEISAENTYGVATFTTTTATMNLRNSSGHWQDPYYSSHYVFCSTRRLLCAVTQDCVIDHHSIVNYASGTTYYSAVAHLQGGDTAVRVANLQGSLQYVYPYQSAAPSPSLTKRDEVMVNSNGVQGIYQITRSGTQLVINSNRRSAAYRFQNNVGLPRSKLNDTYVSFEFGNVFSGAALSLNTIRVWGDTQSPSYTYNFAALISGQNSYNQGYLSDPTTLTFITATGRFFSMPGYNNQGSQSTANVITGYLPIFIPTSTKTYAVTVIGGGGASTGDNGTSSSFVGISANAGSNRTGFVAGSTVISSGPTRNTGGTGYGDSGWGQGEDTALSGVYGGGSGYVITSTATLVAGRVYPYRAGFGPLYGKQGAILISEI